MIKKDCLGDHSAPKSYGFLAERTTVNFDCGCWDYYYRWLWTQKVGPIPEGFVIHHIDGDETNNDLSNLKCISETEHKSLHGKQREWSDETKKKISEGLKNSEKFKAYNENREGGWHWSDESRKKFSELKKVTMKGEGNPFYGRQHTDETKQKISEAMKGRPGPNKGRKFSEESRRKMSEAKKGKPSPRKGAVLSEETKRKISESKKGL